ncbi:MAG: hypothetical protein ACT6RD_07755 [Brevundimonas sp.]|uniref:hypothetical protein n=1 Tax=Brevundimonas sp. TaxID=1871086 RepID=UPI0040344BDA
MAGLTVGAKASLARVIEAIPDDAVGVMRAAVAQMSGERAEELVQMLEETIEDRHRRSTAFRALIPLFRPRRDGLAFLTFPAGVLPRLWRAAADCGVAHLPMLDSLNDEDSSRRALARGRLYDIAARIVRERPEVIWPLPALDSEIAARETGLAELAACCDMGMLAHAAIQDLDQWIVRPNEDRLAEFRLRVRDAAAVDVDGVRRLLDIMAAHVEDASQVLRLTVHAGGLGAEAMLKHSELSVIVERILAGFDERARRIATFRLGDPVAAFRRDLDWVGSVLDAVAVAVQADPQGEWARRVGASKASVARMIEERLGAAPRIVAKVLPLRDAQTAGRMTRRVPRLDEALSPPDVEAATAAADLIAAVRWAAARFGCEARRQAVLTDLVSDLAGYADLAVEALSTGEAGDPDLASARILLIADLLERIEADAEARTVRRRLAALRPSGGGVRAA